jgi:hypothetical protein
MRAGASALWRVAAAAAFGATAAVAVILTRGAPVNAALTAEGTGGVHASAAAQPSAVTARCSVTGLRISLGPGTRVTAAVTRYTVEFTNVSRAACTLTGYPLVTAYRGDGIQVGPAAARDASAVTRRVLLAPGQTAHAVLDASVPGARCRPVRVSGLRVVTPGQSTARYVRRPLTTCAARAARGQNYLLVLTIQPGPGPGTSAGGGTGTLADVQAVPGAA